MRVSGRFGLLEDAAFQWFGTVVERAHCTEAPWQPSLRRLRAPGKQSFGRLASPPPSRLFGSRRMPTTGRAALRTRWFAGCSSSAGHRSGSPSKRRCSAIWPKLLQTKRPLTQSGELKRSVPLIGFFGKYSLAAVTAELVAQYRDKRLAGEDRKGKKGEPIPRAGNTVRLELALLGHLFTVALKEWGLGLAYNPVLNVRRPAPGPGRNRRLDAAEEAKLFKAVDKHSNPMLSWIVRIRAEDLVAKLDRLKA